VTITFSEAVTGFTNADLTVANGTLSAVSSSDGGITWTATFTRLRHHRRHNLITWTTPVWPTPRATPAAGTTSSNNYAVDSVRPTATIVVADPALTMGQTSLVTITFSEAVTGFGNRPDSRQRHLEPVSSSDGGITWTGRSPRATTSPTPPT
jgi:hypothetical protein